MHQIEPYYNWIDYYSATADELSPFYGREYSEFAFSNKIYNYYIHPQWDFFGSSTLYAKVLFADYDRSFGVIELIGEWNDCLHNDVMHLKRELIDPMIQAGIYRFVIIGENVLNFHASDDCYYEEWYEDVADEGGWIAAINFRDHVKQEMTDAGISNYFLFNSEVMNWRIYKPVQLCELIDSLVTRRLSSSGV